MIADDFDDSPLDGPYFEILLKTCALHDLDPRASSDIEAYFVRLLDEFENTPQVADLALWLRERIAKDFTWLMQPPVWIQGPDWPVSHGRPMIFVGQVDVPAPTPHFGHNSASFFVFWDPSTAERRVVLQYD